QGLNPWNLLLLLIILGWMAQQGSEGLTWDLPRSFSFFLVAFLLVVTTSFLRLVEDRAALLEASSLTEVISEYLVNPVKFIVPGLLLFHGCRSRSRLRWALGAILMLYVLLSLQVIRWMPLDGIVNPADLAPRSLKILRAETGYHRVDLSVILAGASWALLAAASLV